MGLSAAVIAAINRAGISIHTGPANATDSTTTITDKHKAHTTHLSAKRDGGRVMAQAYSVVFGNAITAFL